jgi:hypothetical protein
MALTKFETVSTVNVEVVITGFPLAAEGVEDKTVGAELLLGDAVGALVVFVALSDILEGAVTFRASEGLSCKRSFHCKVIP